MANSRVCMIPECDKPLRARGYCISHYSKFRANGTLGKSVPKTVAFLEKALATETDDCIIWPFCRLSKDGYAVISANGRNTIVSRIVCERVYGLAPSPTHQAAHSCGNGHLGCINHQHLRWATPKENCADKKLHGTERRGENTVHAKLTETDIPKIRKRS